MSRFNTRGRQAKPAVATVTSPMGTVSRTAPDTLTFEGAPGWRKDAKTDLFLRASAGFADGGDKFYESGQRRDEILRDLAWQTAVDDFVWFSQFVKWLRRTANIRTAALMIAADGVKARLDAGLHGDYDSGFSNRQVIDSVLYRADEPGELLAYWMSQYGRRVPKPVKRGVADAVQRLYTERSLLKYDTSSHAFRFADVLELCHPRPRDTKDVDVVFPRDAVRECPAPDKREFDDVASASHAIVSWGGEGKLRGYNCRCGYAHVTAKPVGVRANGEVTAPVRTRETFRFSGWQGDLFKHAVDRRHGRGADIPASLSIVQANSGLREDGRIESWLDPEFLRNAGMTWEDALSAVGGEVDKAKLWSAMIPSMGYMALLRNLRNFDQADVSNQVAQSVIQKLVDPDEVAKSRQLPFRFYSAYKNTQSLRWAQALETALDYATGNIPELAGRTLILTDTSQSMMTPMSRESSIKCLEAAGLFASALAQKNAGRVDLYQYADFAARIVVHQGGSVLRMAKDIMDHANRVGWGTNIAGSIQNTYEGHDRIIVLSDGQGTSSKSASGVAASVPENTPVYLFNIEGYSASPMPTGSAARFDLGGLSDTTFSLIPRLEAGMGGKWPWEVEDKRP